ncbi:MAG: hypothetical protein M3332_13135 [Actinomycetota bacterium]|nr:hypothetical protein [Actinomycetota bacterium]
MNPETVSDIVLDIVALAPTPQLRSRVFLAVQKIRLEVVRVSIATKDVRPATPHCPEWGCLLCMMEIMEPDAADGGMPAETSKMASTLTSTLAVLAIIGIFGQVYSYLATRGFYSAYSVDPAELGLTPLNASLRLTLTAFVAVIAIATTISIVVLYLSSLRPLPEGFLLRHRVHLMTPVIVLLVALLAVAGLHIFDWGRTAGFAAKRGELPPSRGFFDVNLSRAIASDLTPHLVTLEWRDQEKMPAPLKQLRRPSFSAQLIGQNGDRYVFYIPEQRLLVRVDGAAVNIYTPLPIEGVGSR